MINIYMTYTRENLDYRFYWNSTKSSWYLLRRRTPIAYNRLR